MALPIFVKPSRSFEWLKERASFSDDECLFWPFGRNWNGYGFMKPYLQRNAYAHRVMCELAHGEPPTPSHVAAHSCGRGSAGCVNPKHLSWKTPRENQLDRRAHGTDLRHVWWTNKGGVPPDHIAKIRALKGKKNQREIASMFGISYQHVSLIQQGKLVRQRRAS